MNATNNNVWQDVTLYSLYTLTPLHVGTGEANDGIDLPVARDAASGFPIVPGTAIKGVIREVFEKQKTDTKTINELFGPMVKAEDAGQPIENEDQSLTAAALAFTESRLLAYPMRSLNRPIMHVTCPAILKRLRSDVAMLAPDLLQQLKLPEPESHTNDDSAFVTDTSMMHKPVIVENLVYPVEQLKLMPNLDTLAQWGQRITKTDLLMIPDSDFCYVMRNAIPVAARTQLTSGKTTDEYINDKGEKEKGNLWYEEYLPAECLFVSFVGQRRSGLRSNKQSPMTTFVDSFKDNRTIQIGGNETVGYGLSEMRKLPANTGAQP